VKSYTITWPTSDGDRDVVVKAYVVPGALRRQAMPDVHEVRDAVTNEVISLDDCSSAERVALFRELVIADGWCRECRGARCGVVRVGPKRTRPAFGRGPRVDASEWEEDTCQECRGTGRAS
jgi:hypothetical protein